MEGYHQLRLQQSDEFSLSQYSSCSEGVDEDPAYKPSDWHKRQQSSMPTVISLPAAPHTGLLHDTTATAKHYSVSAAAHLAFVASTVKAAGGNLHIFTVSHSTVKRHRKQEKATKAESIRFISIQVERVAQSTAMGW